MAYNLKNEITVGIQPKKMKEEHMKKDTFLNLGVSDEIAEKIVELVNAELKDHVPKSRLDNAVEQRDSYKKDFENSNKQLDELKKSVEDLETLKAELGKLQEANKTLISEHELKIAKINFENAADMALIKADAKNVKAVKALMTDFLASAELDGETIKGIDEAISKLKESDGYLFNNSSKSPTGHTPKGNSGSNPEQTPRSVFEARLAEARQNGNNQACVAIKQEASEQGISLL